VRAGLLVALNPVLVHYATQALDATPALTCFLVGLAALGKPETGYRIPEVREAGSQLKPPAQAWESLGRAETGQDSRGKGPLRSPVSGFRFWNSGFRFWTCSLAWAAASVMRPNYLLVWLALPALAWWATEKARRVGATISALTGAVVFAGVALWQGSVSGVPGFLPWQGSYNLWAANQPGAHGRYFAQRQDVPVPAAEANPARVESLHLFQRETGHAPASIAELNAHWRERFLRHVTSAPLSWAGLLLRKTYALLNHWEQYNNKTFAFHQARSPWLRWNPLGWGMLLLVAIVGGVELARRSRRAVLAVVVVTGAVAMGVLLFYVSARFRLPLVGIAAVLAGGAVHAPTLWRSFSARGRAGLALALAGAAGVTFSGFDDVRSRRTFVEDHALLARAAERVGDFPLAWREANAALALHPEHRDATRVAIIAFFNQLVLQQAEPSGELPWLAACRRLLAAKDDDARELQAIAALALWRAGERTAAVAEWKRLAPSPSALAARLLVNDPLVNRRMLGELAAESWSEPLVRLAGGYLRVPPPAGIPPADPRRAEQVLERLFVPEQGRR
jgi:hypothetical protein